MAFVLNNIEKFFENSTFIFLFIIFCVVIYICYLKYKNGKYLKNIPGPKPNFLFGNLNMIFGVPPSEYLNVLMKLIDDYGSIFKFYLGPLFMVAFITDKKFSEYIFSSTKYIDKAYQYSFLHSWIGTGLLTSTGVKWKKRRRMLTPAFHFSILENFVEVFENVSDTFIEKISKEVDKSSVNISHMVSLCTLDIICETAMGTKLNAQNERNSEYVKSVKEMCNIFERRVVFPLPSYLFVFTPDYYRQKKLLKILQGHTESIIEKRISAKFSASIDINTVNKKRLAFLDLLLESTIDGKPLSKLDIREEVDTFMFAGHDTTAAALTFTMYCLAANPEVQVKAIEEQKSMFSNLKQVKPTISELQNMKYLDLVIKESLRLYPPIPTLARCLSEDVYWEGNIYPKNLNVFFPVYAIHRNPEVFHDPDQFIPERFNESNSDNSFFYIPFSAGSRNCIGQKFAMLEMKCILSKVLRNFELLPATPQHDMILLSDIVLKTLNGICIAFKLRED